MKTNTPHRFQPTNLIAADNKSGHPDLSKTPEINTWWVRTSNQKRYFLREIHEFLGKTYVWIYEDGVNRCYHLPLTTLVKNYCPLNVGPVDPDTGNTVLHLN